MKYFLITLAATQPLCDTLSTTDDWPNRNYGFKALDITAHANGAVYIIKKEDDLADWYTANAVSKFDQNKWVKDPYQTVGAKWDIAVDTDGQAAYISDNQAIYWQKYGKWTSKTSAMDCAKRIAFDQEGTLYKLGCELNAGQDIYKYFKGIWTSFSQKDVREFAFDSQNRLWVVSWNK
jgi:hypothetical protein